MKAEEVPEAWVQEAERTLAFGICGDNSPEAGATCDCPTDEQIRVVIAAVLPEIQAQARKALADDLTWLADAREEYQHEDVVKETDAVRVALGVAQGEPAWGWLPSWRWDEWKTRAGRLTATTTEGGGA